MSALDTTSVTKFVAYNLPVALPKLTFYGEEPVKAGFNTSYLKKRSAGGYGGDSDDSAGNND